MIVLSGAAPHAAGLVHAMLHEAAHCWSCASPTAAITAQGEAGLRDYVAKEGLTAFLDSKVAFDECLAHALAAVWADPGLEA